MRDRIVFGPANATETVHALQSQFSFTEATARELVTRADNSSTGMAREPWTTALDVWVTSLTLTRPGEYMIETDFSR
jgi:hypothetical protein